MAISLYISAVVVGFVVYQIFKAWRVNQHWKELGIAHVPPILFFGNMYDMLIRKRTQHDILRSIYEKFPDEKLIGYYHFMSPRLLIREQELIERVLIRDFNIFHDRVRATPSGNPLLVNLFGLCGKPWRAMRAKLSPMFTTGKLRHMFPQVSSLADDLMPVLDQTQSKVDIKEETSKYAMEVISSSAFGIEPGALDGQSEFGAEAKIAFASSFWIMLRRLILFSFPRIAAKLKLGFMSERTVKYFSNIIKTAIVHRRATKAVRNDFVQHMVTLLDKGFIEIEKHDPGDDYLAIKEAAEENFKMELNENVMVGQSFVFLLAGFETTATTMAFMCLDFALNPEAQQRAREEVGRIWKSGDLSYDDVKDMTFLDACLKETLRLHPPVGVLSRLCGKKYTFPGTSVTIEPGQMVVVPALGVHYNPEIYPEPEKFLPDRWTSSDFPPCSYLPFGDGPRVCIGMRFAIMEAKCCLAKILRNYKIHRHPSLELPLKLDPYSLFGSPLNPILLKFQKL